MKSVIPASLPLKLSLWLTLILSAVWLPGIVALAWFTRVAEPVGQTAMIITLLLSALGTSLVVALAWWTCLFPLARRLNQATLGAEQLSRHTLTAPLNDRKADEIGDLSRALDRIARRALQENSQRERDQQSLSHQATHDELTGLSNRKYGNETIARLASSGSELPTSILFLDLDGFKAVNDTCGHAVGDEILVAISLRLKAILQNDTVLIRWGGDEFVIVLPGADQRGAISVAQDVADLFKQPIATTKGVHKLGCSIGLSTSRPNTSLEMVLQEADANMYDQKKKRKSSKEDNTSGSTDGHTATNDKDNKEDSELDSGFNWLDKAA